MYRPFRNFLSKNKKDSLNSLLLVGGFWTVLTHGSSQFIRLAGNLVLTRILAPEMFGLMALVTVILIGIQLITDVGIQQSLIKKKGEISQNFINTLWTFQIVRSVFLYAILIMSAPLTADFFNENDLKWLIPLVGLTVVISGFNSIALLTAVKEMNLKRVSLIDVVVQIITLSFTIVFAYFLKNVTALAIGVLVGAILKLVGSYLFLPKTNTGLACDKNTIKDLFHFGKWIFLSSMLLFFINQIDRILIGREFDSATLGIYTIAFTLAMIPLRLMQVVSGKLLNPYYSKLFQSNQNHKQTGNQINRLRFLIATSTFIVCFFTISLGEFIINILYDERYSEAGPLLRLISVSCFFWILSNTLDPLLLSDGRSYTYFWTQCIKLILFFVGAIVGLNHNGVAGMCIGIAVATIMHLPVIMYVTRNYGVLAMKSESFIFSTGAFLFYLAIWF